MADSKKRLRLFADPPASPHGKVAPPVSESVGGLLARTRRERGQDLEDVSADIKIRPAHLKAIENSRFQELPGPTYAVGFVRTYGSYLGLDGNEVVRQFRAEIAGFGEQADLAFPKPVIKEGGRPSGRILVLSVALAGAVYGLWHYLSADDPAPPPSATAKAPVATPTVPNSTPPAKAAKIKAPAKAAKKRSVRSKKPAFAKSAKPDEPAAAAAKKPADVKPAKPAKPAERAKPAKPKDATAALATPTTPPVQSATLPGKTRLVIRAKLDTWINIRDAAGEIVASMILRSGKVYEVPDRPGLILLTGNAGGLELFLDGRALASLGPVGAVRRDISLDPDELAARP